MPSAPAKKSTRPAAPTWSKVSGNGNTHRTPTSKSTGAKNGSRPAYSSARNGAGKGKARSKARASSSPPFVIPAHLRREITALAMLAVAGLFVVGLLSWSSGGEGIVGVMGGVVAQLFGVLAWLVPVALAAGAVVLLLGARSDARWLSPLMPLGLSIMLLGLMGFAHLFTNGQVAADGGQGGGYVGLAISTLLSEYLTRAGAGVVLAALTLIGFMLAFGVSLAQVVRGIGRPTVAAGRLTSKAIGEASTQASRFLNERQARSKIQSPRSKMDPGPVRINGLDTSLEVSDTSALPTFDVLSDVGAEALDPASAPTEVVNLLGDKSVTPENGKAKPDPVINIRKSDKKSGTTDPTLGPQEPIQSPLGYIWNLPPMNLLETTSELKVSQADIKAKIKVIEDALQSFNVEATVREVNTGPAVTQFAIEPGTGVRVNRITALDKDLALALAAPDIRIEAPIPGQSRVGIEVPNVSLQVVGLRSILESDAFQVGKGRLKIALGRDTHGQPVVTDLAKLPHILVAGATGSGKSVFLNSMVIGFLTQFTPDDLRMLMIDPKRVELTGFNGIPHLLRPVVTDVRLEKDQSRPQKAAKGEADRERPLTAVEALKWALWEMERRYKLFANGKRGKDGISKVFRNIEQYRTFLKENPETNMEYLPYIVIIIDELADLMLTAPEEVETSLCRLAQLARATGIHLVVATQRPSVDVVTGIIKANFPARAAFAVTSQVDSKVILDGGGAEKLLGRGDMLYTASDESKPVRIQGTFVSDAESDKVVHFWRKQLPSEKELAETGVEAPVQPMPMPDWLGTGDANEESELLEQAIELVKKSQYVSVSMLQRKLRIGYNRAARIVEQMEELGLISPANGDNRGKPREVLLGAPDHRADDMRELIGDED
ncbi:MAG TPA: DNA translocase FtsK 4TM domain-containing protein [Chloroflexia bacterium]|nr:DNA translocase FtsK 4TM domain-containing protein [Chloroflexia bacterium]